MLTNEKIEYNKNRFLSLVNSIKREFNKELLIKQLTLSDFFYAPASTKYHCAYDGGLCEHSLNVYDNLKALLSLKNLTYDEDSIIIVALFHDFDKMNKYEKTSKNVKQYREDGTKQDAMGRFEWVSEIGYKKKDDVFTIGSHGQNSLFMTQSFIPLTAEESASIVCHMGGTVATEATDISTVYSKYPLAILLHVADMMSTFIDEERE